MLDYADCVMLRRKKKLDASQGAFISHVDNWKHCRMYLDGGAGNFEGSRHPEERCGVVCPAPQLPQAIVAFAFASLGNPLLPETEIVAPRLPSLAKLLNFSLSTFQHG
jgi:hypothetical protein